MAGSPAFESACEELESATSLSRLEARGTMRLVLKQAGLQARSVSAREIGVVIEKLLPGELGARGVDDPDAACLALASRLLWPQSPEPEATVDAPEEVFRRLGTTRS
jgi:hypothetical protein